MRAEQGCENHDMIMVRMASASKKAELITTKKVVSFVSFLSSPPDSFEVLSTQKRKVLLSYTII
jgi:hypothetical protein